MAALAPVIGTGPAIAVALVSRAVNTISDLLVAGAAAATRRRGLSGTAGTDEGKGQPPIPTESVTPVTSAPDAAS